MGAARRSHGMGQNFDIDWITVRWLEAMILGIDEEIPAKPPDLRPGFNYKGTPAIPAGVPLSLEQAARAVGMRLSRARRLWVEPVVQQAYETACAAYRKSQDPMNLKTAIDIRDNLANAPQDRLRAVRTIEGPRPVQIAQSITNNILEQRNFSAGYVVDLSGGKWQPKQANEPKMLDITPDESNSGNQARDVEAERREAHAVRPSRR